MKKTGLCTMALLGLCRSAWGIPMHAERGSGGPLAGPAWASPATIGLNPAAMPLADGPRLMLEGNFLQSRHSILATRNDGIDPNTGAPYEEAVSESWIPGGYAGVTWPILDNRVALGLALQAPWQTDLDFRQDPSDSCLDLSTRYAAILYQSSSLQAVPAVSVQVIKGLQIGASLSLASDHFKILRTWDPMGTEGLAPGNEQPGFYVPYTNDVLVRTEMAGRHLEWTGGIWLSRIPYVQVGASYTQRQPMALEGTGMTEFSEFMGGVDVPIRTTLDLPLADELRVGLTTVDSLPVQLSLTWGVELWSSCCGERDGDAQLTINDEDDNVIGPEHGVIVEITEEFYIPRRLHNSTNMRAGLEAQVLPNWTLGAHIGSQTHATPDYAVDALQQDFDIREGGLHSGIQLGNRLRLGASYTHRISTPRSITHSAWDVHIITADEIPEDYVDERFSPQLPFAAGGNGEYTHTARRLALRVELTL